MADDEHEMSDEDKAMLAEVVRVLQSRAPRLELERTVFGDRPCVRLYERGTTKGGNPKWTVAGPLLFGSDEDATTHADVLRHIAGIIEQAAADTPSLSKALAEARDDERY